MERQADAPLCNVLIVDDEADTLSTFKSLLEDAGASVKLVYPEDVTRQDLYGLPWDAHVVLMDFELQPWKSDADLAGTLGTPIGKVPCDGLALAAVLRRHVQALEENPPTAFAILTGQLDTLADPLPPEYRNHALASINNLEWVFEKRTSLLLVARQVVALGYATRVLPKRWLGVPENHSLEVVLELLKADVALDNIADSPVVEDVVRCRPPLYELSEWSHGLTVLRWFLHRILPYPSFLLNSHYLAARLGVDHRTFDDEIIRESSPLRQALAGCQYQGILHDFDGPRWWRAKIELWLWNHLQGHASHLNAVRDLLANILGQVLPPSDPSYHPVVCIGEDYQALPGFTSIDDAVRLLPDDWPSYADNAWARLEEVQQSLKLRSLVVKADKERLA